MANIPHLVPKSLFVQIFFVLGKYIEALPRLLLRFSTIDCVACRVLHKLIVSSLN